ncbi:MAG: malate dehydrogenase, partial [Alphaproteobacteria bacterium]|nr:malate dehydrogenase [Alphaproteobacteria bacterium]
MSARRVIGSEHVEDARRRGRRIVEVLPDDIVTPLAGETAARVGVTLVDGPLARPDAIRTDGATSLRRVLYRRSPKWVAPKPSAPRHPSRLGKLALVGVGGVGAAIGLLAAQSDIAHELALVDITPGLAEATALDLNHASGMSRTATRAIGGSNLDFIHGADVIVVTAGRPRTPGMTRNDLIEINRRVIHRVADAIKTNAPKSIVIVVTNPLDEMTHAMLDATAFPRERVLGMAGTLDSSRFRRALAIAAGVTPADVEAITLGAHGDEMVPITSRARIKGRPLDLFLSAEAIEAAAQDAVTGGGQVVALRKTGSATLAPAHATIELIDHIRGARAGSVPASVMLQGEYGISDVVLGVPCHLGSRG